MIGFESFKGRSIDLDDPTDVYRNLNRPGGVWWSLRQRGVVVGHTRSVQLCEPKAICNPTVQARIAAGAKREVHACVRGMLVEDNDWFSPALAAVTYRPHQRPDFYYIDTPEISWTRSNFALFTQEGMFA